MAVIETCRMLDKVERKTEVGKIAMNKKEVVDCRTRRETQETVPGYTSVGNIFIRSNVPNVTMISYDIMFTLD